MKDLTIILHQRGYTVKEACNYWNMNIKTYYDKIKNPKLYPQIESMCNGIPNRKDT